MLVSRIEHAVHIQIASSYNGKKKDKPLNYLREDSDLIDVSSTKILVETILLDCNWKICIKKSLEKVNL